MDNENILNNVFTATEAATLWKLAQNTVKISCQLGRFKSDEHRKSQGAWLVTRAGMERLYGEQKIINPV